MPGGMQNGAAQVDTAGAGVHHEVRAENRLDRDGRPLEEEGGQGRCGRAADDQRGNFMASFAQQVGQRQALRDMAAPVAFDK